MAEAAFYDGETARRRLVSLSVSASGLDLRENGARLASWPCDAVRRLEGPEGVLRLGLSGEESLARLEVSDDADRAAIRAHCRFLDKGEGAERTGRIVIWSLAAAASLVSSAVVLVPLVAERLAPLVPLSLEKRLGAAVDNQVRLILRAETCEAEGGRAALANLSERLASARPSAIPPDVAVLGSRIPNAVALPGGRIYLFEGLLKEAVSPDEIAGVLAHEIGHVANRDGLRALIRTGGTSFLLGLLFGDVTGSGAVILFSRLMLDNAHSRDAERAADAHAMDSMLALGRPPRALGEILGRIDDGDGKVPAFLSTHPLTGERLEALDREPRVPGEPLLTEGEWRALKDICKAE
jgi:Zn-dependent protease with chaperone function